MNNQTIDYTSEEFWATAPKDAEVLIDHTHFAKWDKAGIEFWWSTKNNVWDSKIPGLSWSLQKYVDTNSFDIIPRPTTFTKPVQENPVGNSDWFVDGKCVALPPVGTICEYYADEDEWRRCEIVAHKDGLAVVWVNEVHIWTTRGALLRPIKKEPTIQEKILEAWKAQGIDFAYDNEDTDFSFKVLVDFVVNNFDVKEKQ